MSTLTKLALQIKEARAKLDSLEAQYTAERLAALKLVECTKVGETFTLTFNGRVLKAKKNPIRGRFKIHEGKAILVSEYYGGIHDIRFDLSQGRI